MRDGPAGVVSHPQSDVLARQTPSSLPSCVRGLWAGPPGPRLEGESRDPPRERGAESEQRSHKRSPRQPGNNPLILKQFRKKGKKIYRIGDFGVKIILQGSFRIQTETLLPSFRGKHPKHMCVCVCVRAHVSLCVCIAWHQKGPALRSSFTSGKAPPS